MPRKSQANTRKNTANVSTAKNSRSLPIFEKGIKTGADFANGMSALMSDIIANRVTPGVGNAVCNAGGKLLKAVEMQHKYGRQLEDGTRQLQLAEFSTSIV